MSKESVSDRDLAYAAGLFDGEGCIHIGRHARGYKLQVMLTNTHRPVLDWFQSIWGGKLYDHPSYHRKRWTMCWTLQWGGKDDEVRLLTDLLPNFQIKRDQALLALRFLDTVNVPHRMRDRFIIRATRATIHEEFVALRGYVPRREVA